MGETPPDFKLVPHPHAVPHELEGRSGAPALRDRARTASLEDWKEGEFEMFALKLFIEGAALAAFVIVVMTVAVAVIG
jgi:hypothetical protein